MKIFVFSTIGIFGLGLFIFGLAILIRPSALKGLFQQNIIGKQEVFKDSSQKIEITDTKVQ